MEFVVKYGVSPSSRGDPWAVWSGKDKDDKQLPLQMITWGTLTRAIYLAIERHGVSNVNIQATMNSVQVKNMGGATELEHHIVGDVHQCRHTALTAARQAIHHPLWRARLGIDVSNHTTRKPSTSMG